MHMATMLLNSDSSHHGMTDGGNSRVSLEKPEDGCRWYFSKKKIEEDSPSRKDGITLKKETYIRKSYSTFLQELGMRLKMRQVRIATAIIFCHRFFLRQSHAKNDWQTIATVCMFLAGKAEESPRPLKDVIVVSYEIIHKKDPAAMQRIKQKEAYEKQKELILLGERVVLGTLGFDFNVPNLYKPLVEVMEKFKLAQTDIARVAWNFVNDALGTSLSLQFKPHHIAAGAIFLAAKYLNVKLPTDGDKLWWQQFDVTPRQLEVVSNQIMELYGQIRAPPKAPIGTECATQKSNSQGAVTTKAGNSKPASSGPLPEQSNAGNHGRALKATQKQSNEYGSTEKNASDHEGDGEVVNGHLDQSAHQEDTGEIENISEGKAKEDEERFVGSGETDAEAGEVKLRYNDNAVSQSTQEAIKKIDIEKIKAALERRKKARVDLNQKKELMDVDDLIERELEDGIELATDREKTNGERRQSWEKTLTFSEASEHENGHGQNHQGEDGEVCQPRMEDQSPGARHVKNVEEEVESTDDDAINGYRSPNSSNRKRKAGSSPEQFMQGTQLHENCHGLPDDRDKLQKLGYSETDHNRHVLENHV